MSMSPFQLVERLVSQKIEKSLSKLFDFLVPSAAFLTLLSVGCLLYWLFSALFKHLKKPNSLRSSKECPQIKILRALSIFFLMFQFFNGQLFASNLNTSNVIVDVSGLLYSREQIIRTEKECVSIKTLFVEHRSQSLQVFNVTHLMWLI